MDINIRINERDFEDFVQEHLRHRVDVMVKNFLEFQLKGIVEGRLAEMRLLNPASCALDDVIAEALSAKITNTVHDLIPSAVRHELKNVFGRI